MRRFGHHWRRARIELRRVVDRFTLWSVLFIVSFVLVVKYKVLQKQFAERCEELESALQSKTVECEAQSVQAIRWQEELLRFKLSFFFFSFP